MPPRPETYIPDPETGAPHGQGPADDSTYTPNAAQTEQGIGQLGTSDSSDGSGSIFSMYLERAEEEDKKSAKSWKGDADGLLVFTGLFSTAVAALLAVTIQDIRPNLQATSNFYLATIIQQLNGTQVSTLSDPAASFSPPTWAVWVNGLWFMSLVISLTCAVLATLLQQWSRQYLRVAYPRYSPHKRARIRAFYADGVQKLYLQKVVNLLPVLLHISLFLFFSGLSVFLFHVNSSIFKGVITWVGLCAILYAYLTILPIRYKNSPYSSPLSGLVSFCLTGIRSRFSQVIERWLALVHPFPFIIQHRNHDARVHLGEFFSRSMRTTAEKFALLLGPEIDHDSMMWMFRSLDEDKDLEQFFEGIPGLCNSRAVPDALNFIKRNEKIFSSALIEFVNRTLSSNLVPEAVKIRRIIICTKAVDATSLLGPWSILHRVLLGDWQKFLRCVEFGLFIQKWRSIGHPLTRFYAQCVAAITISSVHEPDDRWFELSSGALGASKHSFQDYVKHTDSILLANVIYIVRRTIHTYSGSGERHRSDILGASSKTLGSLRRFHLNLASPDLQGEFCSVWNQLVDLAQNDGRPHIVPIAINTLRHIRGLYIRLHKQGTSSHPMTFSSATDDGEPDLCDPRSYCKCTIAEHCPSQPVPDLQIEEPAPEVAINSPPTPAHYGMTPATHPQVVHPSFLTLPRPHPSVQPPSFPQPAPGTSNENPQPASVTFPIVDPTSPVRQTTLTLPIKPLHLL